MLAPRLHTLAFGKTSAGDSLTGDTSTVALYQKAIVIDSLCGPLNDMDTPPSAETLAAVRGSGITAINSTISAPGFEDTIGSLAAVQELEQVVVACKRVCPDDYCRKCNELP